MMFNKVALIGLGLIGSSLGHAMKRAKLAHEIAGFDSSDAVRRKASSIGFVDTIGRTPAATVKNADLVILCTPVGAYKSLAGKISSHLKMGAILSDVGSVKGAVVKDVEPYLPKGVHFIPAHPIAGTEFSGPEAGFASLFDGRWAILTPVPGSMPRCLAGADFLTKAIRATPCSAMRRARWAARGCWARTRSRTRPARTG